MKNIVILLALTLPMVVFSQRRPKIKGNRTVTSVRQELPVFSKIELRDNLEVRLKKSRSTGVEIIADDNLVDVLKFEVKDSTLVISSFYDIIAKKKLEITVDVMELKSILMTDGKLLSDDLIASDNLYLGVYGRSELDIDVIGFSTQIEIENNGKVDLNLDIDSLDIIMKHKSDARIYTGSVNTAVTLLDTASLTLEGSGEYADLNLSGNSKIKADKMEAAEVNLQITSSGFARVNAFRSFVLNATGSSKTFLYGNPKITIETFLDTSQLLKKSD